MNGRRAFDDCPGQALLFTTEVRCRYCGHLLRSDAAIAAGTGRRCQQTARRTDTDTHVWVGRKWLPDRHGQPCRLLVAWRGKFLIEFADWRELMGATKIEWTDYTWNPWRGCQKVSAGCANCYADSQSRRSPDVLGLWGPPGTGRRVVAAESYWRLPLQWDRKAAKEGVRRRVFLGSLMDWAEQWDQPVWRDGRDLLVADEEPDRWLPRPDGSRQLTLLEQENLRNGVYRQLWLTDVRRRMFDTMRATKHLDWLLLTKRPENVPLILADITGLIDWFDGQPQYWIGTSVEDQQRADERIPHLLEIPAAVRFLSVEPLLGPVDLTQIRCTADPFNSYNGLDQYDGDPICRREKNYRVDWVIVGGESGPNARPCDLEWIRSIVAQCRAAGVPVFVKQLGAQPVDAPPDEVIDWNAVDHGVIPDPVPVTLRHPKGGDPSEWPEDLRVRQFPDAEWTPTKPQGERA